MGWADAAAFELLGLASITVAVFRYVVALPLSVM